MSHVMAATGTMKAVHLQRGPNSVAIEDRPVNSPIYPSQDPMH